MGRVKKIEAQAKLRFAYKKTCSILYYDMIMCSIVQDVIICAILMLIFYISIKYVRKTFILYSATYNSNLA